MIDPQTPIAPAFHGRWWIVFLCAFASCSRESPPASSALQDDAVREAKAFIQRASDQLETLGHRAALAEFTNGTDGTPEHEKALEEAKREQNQAMVALWKEAGQFSGLKLPPATARQLELLRTPAAVPPPFDAKLAAEYVEAESAFDRHYKRAAKCAGSPPCRSKNELYDVIRTSRDPDALLSAWTAWHDEGAALRTPYVRTAELLNIGARDRGASDAGATLRSQYEMSPDQFLQEYDRLWEQVQPLYKDLHCHVRAKLREHYGERVPEHGLIPAHLLGNMWGQFWQDIDELLDIPQGAKPLDVTKALEDRNTQPLDMVRMAEKSFRSMGFPELPKPFWENSLFADVPGKVVECHESAWPIDPKRSDVRLKMCIKVNEEHLRTLHHELGHIYYYLAYAHQPYLFHGGANPGFHEALGDTLALAITPGYLKQMGLAPADSPADSDDLQYLMRVALEKVPALAMSVVVDTWRWKVYSGEISAERYNEGWWEQVRKYQGMSRPKQRTEKDFDAGMFYHVAYGVPYDRYFTAGLLQFDFYRALCKTAGHKGELHHCSFFGSKAAGDRLRHAMSLGTSEPWPDVLQQLTGRSMIDGSALVEYLAPAHAWLKQQNKDRKCGW